MSTTESKNEYTLGLWGIAVHLIILWGVLDANFHSPVIGGLPAVPPAEGPAKRLLLFVADGLRYRTFADWTPDYLKNVTEMGGVWGVSHTRVPTESRPGNVAITAGLYEDPSALFKGWKENPVDFDSVFNRSSVTWAWGSPDIVPMFVKGSHGNVHGETYPHDWQDFDKSSHSPLRLDTWVFDRYEAWLKTEAAKVKHQRRVILFFHLLGCDTAGHSSKPASREYRAEMAFVDGKIREAVGRAEEYFGDDSTAYIFTSDHGMTEWGSHGGGSRDETETPFVAWGAGLGVSNQRRDIQQADIAPLISSLLGISIPTNSEGILPRLFLKSANETYGLRAILNNIKQLIIQVKANRLLTSGDVGKLHWREVELDKSVEDIERLLRSNKTAEALRRADDAVGKCREALYHYRRLQRNQLIIYLTLLWAGWIVLLVCKLVGRQKEALRTHWMSAVALANAAFFIAVILLVLEHNASGRRDWRVLGYGIAAFFSIFFAARKVLTHSLALEMSENYPPAVAIGSTILLIATISVGIVHRGFFSLAMIVAAVMQRVLMKSPDGLLLPTALAIAVYPLLPTLKPGANIAMILVPLCAYPLLTCKQIGRLIIVEIVRIVLTVLVITETIDGRNVASWIILMSSPVSILIYPTDNKQRKLCGVTLGFLCPLALLSASYEPQVFCLLGLHLRSLLQSVTSEEKTSRTLSLRDFVTAAYFTLYVLLSFFGTGNMASISSFDPMWTRHFVTVFSPFTMTTLILLKLGMPLILVGCASRVLVSSSTFLAVLLLGDCLSLPLMYGVTSQGSWLDIGTAISRFTISITLPCLFVALYYISSPLMLFSFLKSSSDMHKKEHLI